jgi:hypothetical protein
VQRYVKIRLQEEACENVFENVAIPFCWTLAMRFHCVEARIHEHVETRKRHSL